MPRYPVTKPVYTLILRNERGERINGLTASDSPKELAKSVLHVSQAASVDIYSYVEHYTELPEVPLITIKQGDK